MSRSGNGESRRRRVAIIVGGLLAVLFGNLGEAHVDAQQADEPAAEPSGLAALLALEDVLVETIARNERSVVSIARVKREPEDAPIRPGEFPNPFNTGRQPSADFAEDPTSPDFIPHEYGTGVAIDAAGLILTNAHVLGRRNAGEPDEEDEIWVTTVDRRPYRAEIVAADGRSDLAVLRIQATDLTPIAFGDASTLRKGQIVISLGNPYAIARDGQVSAAWGMISNLARKAGPLQTSTESPGVEQKPTLHHYGNLIQTDARLNLGTSGGPLLNLRGEMIGLTTSQAALEGYEQSAGYAIPVNDVFLRAVEALREGRELEYGFLGVGPSNLGSLEIQRGGLGMRIANVIPGAPADLSHLENNDVVIAVNGREIYDQDGLMLEIGRLPVDTPVSLTVQRGGRIETVDVKLAKSPPRGLRIVTRPSPTWRGMRVDYSSVLAELVARHERTSIEAGVAVVEVEPQSAAWQAGLRSNMVITDVGTTRVQTPGEFHAAIAEWDGEVEVVVAPENAATGLNFLEEVSLPRRFNVRPTAE